MFLPRPRTRAVAAAVAALPPAHGSPAVGAGPAAARAPGGASAGRSRGAAAGWRREGAREAAAAAHGGACGGAAFRPGHGRPAAEAVRVAARGPRRS